jgi:hypothetical protein
MLAALLTILFFSSNNNGGTVGKDTPHLMLAFLQQNCKDNNKVHLILNRTE